MPSNEEERDVIEPQRDIQEGTNAKMAALIGHIDAFDEATEQWSTYVERFEHFVSANDVPQAKLVAVFLSVMGATTWWLITNS